MEYKGIEYSVVQASNPTGFKRTVQLDAERTKTGANFSRAEAIAKAELFIDKTRPPKAG
jgi:hypothetical protein